MKQRRSFLLMELLISLLLLSTTAALFLYPLRTLRKEVLMLKRLELERAATNALLLVHATLLEGKIERDAILKEQTLTMDFGSVRFAKLREEVSKDGKEIFLIRATVKLSDEVEASRLLIFS